MKIVSKEVEKTKKKKNAGARAGFFNVLVSLCNGVRRDACPMVKSHTSANRPTLASLAGQWATPAPTQKRRGAASLFTLPIARLSRLSSSHLAPPA